MLTMACNQDKELVVNLKNAATGVRRDSALQRLLTVVDTLVELVVARTIVHSNVQIGGAARLWQRLIHASLEGGIDGANAPQILRDILASLRQWLMQSSYYVQVAGPIIECTRLIQVKHIPVPRPIISSHPLSFSGNVLGFGPRKSNRLR